MQLTTVNNDSVSNTTTAAINRLRPRLIGLNDLFKGASEEFGKGSAGKIAEKLVLLKTRITEAFLSDENAGLILLNLANDADGEEAKRVTEAALATRLAIDDPHARE